MKKLIFFSCTVVVLIGCNKSQNEFDATGVFEATEIIISAEASGKILGLSLSEGSELKAGDVVGNIDCQNLSLQKSQVQASVEALSLKQNSASPQVEILREQLNTQQSQIATQKEQLRLLERERNRLDNLVKADAVPSKQLDDVTGQIEVLKKQIQTSEGQGAVLRQQIRSQEAQVGIQNRGVLSERKPLQERIAQLDDQLKRCSIVNPVAGTVLVKYADLNEITTIGKPLYKIADMRSMVLRAYVSGEDLGRIKTGQNVKVFMDNGPDTYKEMSGTIEWIASKAEFTPKTIQTKDERANLVYAIKVQVKNDGFLKIGMYGEVKI